VVLSPWQATLRSGRAYRHDVDGRAIRLHQVHSVKLATDISAELVSCSLLCQRRLLPGLLTRLVPPLFASAVLLRQDLEPLANTARGQYVLAHMPPSAQAVRAIGDILTAWGSWRRSAPMVVAGAVIIAGGWSFGLRGRG
jgi:hypothetical protein